MSRRVHPARGRRTDRHLEHGRGRSRPSSTTASGLLSATWFYPATAIICGLVGLAIGSSWTTAATLGVAFVALAPLIGVDPVITAGAVISGAYFGDKMTPISETTVLVPSMVGGVTTQQHIGAMIWTSGPGGRHRDRAVRDPGPAGRRSRRPPSTRPQAQAALASEFSISLVNLLPMLPARHPVAPADAAVPVDLLLRPVRGRPRLVHAARAVAAFVNKPDQGALVTNIEALYAAHGQRLRLEHRQRADRRAVLARRHVGDAHDDLAGPRRAELRRRSWSTRASWSGSSGRSSTRAQVHRAR